MNKLATVAILNFQKEVRKTDIKFYVTFSCDGGDDYPMDNFFDCLYKWESKTIWKDSIITSKNLKGWDLGMDMAEPNEDGSITFGEYFSKTSAVEGIIAEIERMYFDDTYSTGCTRPFYFRRLLLALAQFWD